jgi:putative ABC transport system substrate-binding protein
MRRRDFVILLGSAVATWPMATRAQQPMPVVGYLGVRSADTDAAMVDAFRDGLKESGIIEGQNVRIEFHWAEGNPSQYEALARSVVQRKPSVIFVSGGLAFAVKAATKEIPIVFNVGTDPIEYGLVSSLNRPGSNLTGSTSFIGAMETKQLGLLQELVPAAKRFAMLVDPTSYRAESQSKNVMAAAQASGNQLIVVQADSEIEINNAFATISKAGAEAVLINTSPFFVISASRIIELCLLHKLPTMFGRRRFFELGGLISYSSSFTEEHQQLGSYVARILKGESPGDLPVLQPTKFEMLINLKTAKSLGITVPPMLLARADEVIE